MKIVKVIKPAPTCSGSHKIIIREPHPVLSKNYVSGTNIDVVSVMAAYAAITLTTSILVHW